MFKSLAVLSLVASTAYGHAFITSVQSANGLSASSFGVDTTGAIPRNGTTEQPFQLDTPVLKDLITNPCGSTLQGGSIDIATALKAQEDANNGGLPSVPSNGTVTLGLHQVNADGGGPFTAEVNADATGKTWVAATVTSQPPGENGLLHNGPADSFITLQMPSDVTCSGGTNGNACLIRLNNGGQNSTSFSNGAGPFGGCVAVSQDAATGTGSSSSSSSNSTSTTTSSTTSTNKNKNKGGKAVKKTAKRSLLSARSIATIDELTDMVSKREALEQNIQEKRQLLTAQLIDELETATGTAIDIPIDNLAGHDDFSATGGNSTAAASGATLTTQQAIDLKKAVQLAIDSALIVMANGNIDAGSQGQDSSITDKANADAAASLAAGETTSVNLGNAGVGIFNTANVDSLLDELATVTDSVVGATATAVSAGTTTAANAKATATAATGKTGAGKGSNRNKGNGAASGNGAAFGAKGGKNAAFGGRSVRKNRVRSWE